MKNKKGLIPSFIGLMIIGVVIGILLGGAIIQRYAEPEIKEVFIENNQPMLLVDFDSWGENIEDSFELVFSYFIINFGNTEAKNIKIRCEITDINDNIIKKDFFNIGNIASNSYEWQTSSIKGKFQDNYMGMCYLDSADGDYINLFERLDEE